MPPRNQTLPPAQTSSAREAQKSFYCQLCSKGYSRMNDYEAHLGSYDHSHKQRLRDMKVMTRDPNAAERARRAEAKADGLVSIKLAKDGPGGTTPNAPSTVGFKKAGFKKAGFKSAFTPADSSMAPSDPPAVKPGVNPTPVTKPSVLGRSTPEESDTEDEGYEVYNPRFPTD